MRSRGARQDVAACCCCPPTTSKSQVLARATVLAATFFAERIFRHWLVALHCSHSFESCSPEAKCDRPLQAGEEHPPGTLLVFSHFSRALLILTPSIERCVGYTHIVRHTQRRIIASHKRRYKQTLHNSNNLSPKQHASQPPTCLHAAAFTADCSGACC